MFPIVQKLWLKDFELYINPATAQAGLDYLQRGQVKNLREVEKHFWVTLVDTDEGAYETEMMLTPNKIRAFTCECWAEGRKLMCGHIAASLFKVRQFLEKRAEEHRQRAQAREKTDTHSRLTVQAALENVTAEELLSFVRAYARRDRDFSLALKTWFASNITGPENPFILILDSVIPKNSLQKPLRETEIRRLRRTLDDLSDQLEIAIQEKNFRTAFQIGSAILKKITPLYHKLEDSRRSNLLEYLHTTLKHLTEPSGKPRELQEAIWMLLLDLGGQGIVPVELERNWVAALSEGASDSDKFDQLNALFDRTPYPAPPLVLGAFLAALANKPAGPTAVIRVLQDYSEKPIFIRDALVQLYYLRHWETVRAAAEFFLSVGLFNAAQCREVEDLLLLIAEKTNDRQRLYELLRRRFLNTGQPELYQRLKTAAGEEWPLRRENLLSELREAPNHRLRLAAVLAAEGENQELVELLRAHGSFEEIRHYQAQLFEADPEFVRQQYVEAMKNYLSNHFGRPAAAYLRDQLTPLIQRGHVDLTVSIIRALITQFEDRPALPDELAEMLPPARRKDLLQPDDAS